MVLEEIAVDTVASLTAYLTRKVSGKLAEKTEELYQKVKEKFEGGSYAEQTLKRVEENPMSKGGQTTLEEIMVEKMKEDSTFAEEIKRLVEEVRKTSGSIKVIVSGDRSVGFDGDMIGSTITTGDNNSNRSERSD